MKRLMILLSLLVVLSGVYFYSRRPPTEAQKTENDAQSAKEDAAAQADIKHMLETRRPLTPEEEAQRAAEDAAAQADAKRMLENVIRESEYLMSLPPEEKEIVLLKRRSEDLTAPPYPDLEMEPKDSQPPTAWREAEMKRYAALFDGAKVDLLIVPFQVQGYGISRTHRSLMSALLSSTLSRSVKVANPYLLARALGDTDRRIDRGAVFRLASRVGAKRILWTYAGHRDAASLDLYFQFQEPGKDGSFSETPDLPGKAIANIAFDDENPPVLAFRKNLAKIVETLGYAFSEVPTLAAKDLESAIPADFTAILRPEDPANSALQLQMLAHLLPEDAYRAKLRLFERSLLLAWQLPPEHPATRQLLARAYYSIGMRLPALAAIKSPQNDVEHALVALLNGNLPDLENHRARIQNSPQRLMAEIDVSDVRYAYEKPPGEDTRSFQDKLPEPLKHFFERRIEDGDPVKLHRFSNFQVLRVLGEEFPSAGQGIVQMLRRKLAAVQRMGSEEVDMLLENYLKPTLALADPSPYNTSMSWGPHRLDILEFLTQSGLSNLIYAADRMARSQAVYNSAIGYIKGIGPLFGSHPEILSARAYAEYHGPIQQLSGEARKDLYAQYAKNVHMSGYWKHMSYDYLSSDRPSSSLANITYGAYRLKNLFQATRNVTLKERLLKETEGRLDGSGVREILAVDLYEAQGNMQAAKTALQDFVKTKPTDFIAYNRLGEFLIKEGEYRQAADVFETFPGLDKEGRSVTSDNHAYDIASRFFWMGENELAKPFFKIAAASHTGSGASMMSAVRLSLIDGDYSDAMRRLYGAVRRYPLSQRYNDYFSLLHVFGASQAAWDGFLVVVANSSEPHVWDSLLVGHRRLRYSDEKIVDWLKQPPLEGKTGMKNRYLTLAAATDRIPGQTLIDAARKIVNIPDSESHFLEAYRALKKGDYQKSYETFQKIAWGRYGIERYGFMLPYYALAAAKSGNAQVFDRQLTERYERNAQMTTDAELYASFTFEYTLSKSVLAALSLKPKADKEAETLFMRAFHAKRFVDKGGLGGEYQMTEVANMLFELTGRQKFREIALRMARANQVAKPWESWPHAFVAVYSEKADEREASLVRAAYLDPQSAWLSRLPQNERDEAMKKAEKSPPFKSTPKSPGNKA